jgi:hypothetical protein
LSSVPVSRPEVELLLRCAQTIRSPQTTDRLRALIREDIDWDYLLQTAYRHKMGPLLYWHLDATRSEAIPENALAHLRDHFLATSQRNLFLTGELLRLLSIFETHGIPVIPYKGPALAASVYGGLALREFGDLDILVKRHHVPKAKEVLVSMGYQAEQPGYRLTRAQEADYFRSHNLHTFTRSDGKSIVELHWEIVSRSYSFSLGTERLWGRLNRIPLGDNIVPNLPPEDMLLILCVHGYTHLWRRLGWICDVAQLVRVHQDMAWQRIMTEARALGGERMLFLGLFLANDLLGAALPKRVQQKVYADPAVKAIAERVYEQLFQETGSRVGWFYAHALRLRMRERLLDKIRYCVYMATTPTAEDWRLLTLPDALFYFYYVLRPIRLTAKHRPRMLKRFL